jgi:bifunctional non-homologous end joining protein LigD
MEPSASERPSQAAASGVRIGAVTEYDRKRDFAATPEPPQAPGVEGDVDPLTAPPGERFVIHQHHATRLHHDVRLEMMNGDTPVLVSWAVPKGLPRERGVRALAIRTEDHPIEYATFSGTIEAGNYGAGEVRIFDSGTYEVVDRTDDKLTFLLRGERLRGVYHLIHTGSGDEEQQWLALLSEDQRPPADTPPKPEPMLASLASEPFDDPAWSFEPEWDGIRAIATCTTETRLVSRRGNDVTAGYPELHHLHDFVVALDAMVDGEIVAFDNGVPSFQKLQSRMHVRGERQVAALAAAVPVVFIAFDLMYLDGRDLTHLPYRERRALLENTLVTTDVLQMSPSMVGDGKALFAAASQQGMEGIVAKRTDSRYVPGTRSKSWLKIKATFDADVVIVGWTEGTGRREATLGSLVMAVYDGGELTFVGNVGTGFDERSLADAMEKLTALGETEPPLSREVIRSRPELRRAHWVPPTLVARVEYRQLTEAGRLRAPVFHAFRDDKRPKECTTDQFHAIASG